jgi:biotin carboxyl carrier protein
MNQITTRDRTTADAAKTATPDTISPGTSQADAPARTPARRRRNLVRPILMLGGIAVVIAGTGYVWLNGGRMVSTDDSYVEAAEVNATTDVSGIVSHVLVHEGETVKTGQVLFQLGQHRYQIAVDGAKAKLAETALTLASMKEDYQRMLKDSDTAAARVAEDQSDFGRYASLIRSGGVTRAEYDDAKYKLEADQANLAALQEQAKTQLAGGAISGLPERTGRCGRGGTPARPHHRARAVQWNRDQCGAAAARPVSHCRLPRLRHRLHRRCLGHGAVQGDAADLYARGPAGDDLGRCLSRR